MDLRTTASLQGRKERGARCEARALSKSKSTSSVGIMAAAACEHRGATRTLHVTHGVAGECPRS
eukprot:5568983-Lingulodinium_polyedra.AAC.1